jgi:ATP synthase protein I
LAEDEPGQDFHGAEDPRLTRLDDGLRAARAQEALRSGQDKMVADGGYSMGNRVLAAMIGSLVGSALVGWVLDRFLGTSPWLLIVMLFLGIAVAFRQIIKISGERPDETGRSPHQGSG